MVDWRNPAVANENAFQRPLLLRPDLVPLQNSACYVRNVLASVRFSGNV